MLNTTQAIHYTGKKHQPQMKHITTKISQLFNKIIRLCKPAPNEFDNRYGEKSINPDHNQWQGGRLLSQQELDNFNAKQKS